MFWLSDPDERPPALPAVWLIATGARPEGLEERSLLRRRTGRRIVARRLGLPEQDVAIDHDARGRPEVTGPTGTRLRLSLATRAGVVAVALAEAAIGVDVEAIDPGAPLPALLHAEERRTLEGLPAAARPEAFARLWAAKEAYVKALGTGFARPPESFAVTLDGQGRFRVLDPQRPGTAEGETRLTKNGGQVSLAAAVIVLG